MSLARFGLAAIAIAALSTGSPAVAGDDAWITIERGAAQHALAGLAAAGRPGALVIMDAASSDALSVRAADTDIVVARVDSAALDLLPEILHPVLRRCGGFIWQPSREEAEAAAAAANNAFIQRIPEPPIPYTIDNGPVVQALMAPMQEVNVRNTITSLGAFFTRHRNCPTGLDSALWIRDTWLALAASRPDVTVELYNHLNTPQPSVVLTITGSTMPSQVVVLGGHRDSVAGSNCTTSRSPGEDDDASGIANLTEVIRVAMALNYRPLRTVKFMAYAGEEGGLLGSFEIARDFRTQNVDVVGVLQLDMTNYKGSSGDIYLYTDFTDPEQNTFVGNLVDTYLQGLIRGTSACGYGCSDHASWFNRGYPASFPFEAVFGQHNPTIHTSQDTIAQSGNNANHALKFTKLAAAYMAEVAKGGLGPNQVPIANAGSDHQVSPLTTYLDGRASLDPDNGPAPLTFLWTQISGPPVTLKGAATSLARFWTPYLRSTFVFRLTVSDGMSSSTDEVTIHPRTEP
jgi:bacterial leucyl aminopeptidase